MIEKNDIGDKKVEKIDSCPGCGSKYLAIDPKRAELFCVDCGLVIQENLIDLGPEWRAYDFDQLSRRARTGAPMTFRIHDKGLGTLVTWSPITPGQYKLKKWQQQTHIASTSERSFIFALGEMDRMACALKLPMDIKESASMLYRKAMKKRLIRGRSIEGIASAILYITCRQYGVPRTLEEVRDISRVGQKEISRAVRFLLRKLDLKVSSASPVDFVPRFCSLLNLSSEIRSKAIEIIKHAEERELTNGRGPIGIAAAAIYISAILQGEHRTQKEISDVTDVTEVTIRNRYKEIAEELSIDVLNIDVLEDFSPSTSRPASPFSKLKPEKPKETEEETVISFIKNEQDDLVIIFIQETINSLGLKINSDIKSFIEGFREEVERQRLIRTKGIEEIGAAIIAITTETYGLPVTQKEISQISGVDRKAIRDTKKLLLKMAKY